MPLMMTHVEQCISKVKAIDVIDVDTYIAGYFPNVNAIDANDVNTYIAVYFPRSKGY